MKNDLSRMYKVPFRMVFCPTFKSWIKATIWCHFVMRLFPFTIDLDSDPFIRLYIERPEMFLHQYEFMFKRVIEHQEKQYETSRVTSRQ